MKKISLVFSFLILLQACVSVKVKETPTEVIAKTEDKKSKEKSFKDLVTDKSKTDTGVFNVHLLDGKYMYEIPQNLLGKEMLWVTRISQIPSDLSPYLNAGSATNEQVVTWELKNDKVILKSISYTNIANDSLPISISVKNNNLDPILASFDIELKATDSTGILINVNKLFEEDLPAFSGLSARLRKEYKVTRLDKSRSFIDEIRAFPTNVEVKHTLTYSASEPPANKDSETLTMQMNQSMILLPENPMISRMNDDRVGWFTTRKYDYSSEELKSDQKKYLRKWRLEPKDKAAYLRGELVEPIKPIVYYLDPATPEKFRPYFIQGIQDWQVAFEKAGFKNAIIAKMPPTKEEDPDFSPEDARYSVVRYVASTTRNAIGPSVSDPRTGEILESDIIWYHNHLRSYRNRYLIETGAANPAARTLDIPTEEIGEMMRRVICHEVGHALGLPHNMKASSAYPTDSLRSGAFTQKYGIATTIMDYARFNYVAQPGDEGIRFVRQLGPYDEYAIEFGYRWYPEVSKPEDEWPLLQKFVTAHSENPLFQFGGGYPDFDPASQTECVGDDAMKASTYGKKNLQVVTENLIKWTTKEGQTYEDLEEIYGEVLGIWNRYVGHVTTNIGGINETRRVAGQGASIYEPVSGKTQKEAVAWLVDNALQTPTWLMNSEISQKISYEGVLSRIISLQKRQINDILEVPKMQRIVESNFSNSSQNYSLIEMISDVSGGVWNDLGKNNGDDDPAKRALQRNYVLRIEELLKDEKKGDNQSDINAVLKSNIRMLKEKLKSQKAKGIQKAHYEDIVDRIDHILSFDK